MYVAGFSYVVLLLTNSLGRINISLRVGWVLNLKVIAQPTRDALGMLISKSLILLIKF